MSARLASTLLVGILVATVGISLVGGSGDGASPSPAAALTTARPASTRTPGAAWTSEPATAYWPEPTPGWIDEVPSGPVRPTAGTPLPDVAHALAADDGAPPLPLGTVNETPNPDRLDFLAEGCEPEWCFRDAQWIDPGNPHGGSGTWTAGRPFHVREGFVNDRPEPLGDGFDVVLYVTRLDDGPDEPTYRYTSDYVLRGTSDRCGPTYTTQTEPTTCEWFVHDFPEGLPEGRWAIWAVWEAPCWAWVEYGLISWCDDRDDVMALFSSGFDAPYDESDPGSMEESS